MTQVRFITSFILICITFFSLNLFGMKRKKSIDGGKITGLLKFNQQAIEFGIELLTLEQDLEEIGIPVTVEEMRLYGTRLSQIKELLRRLAMIKSLTSEAEASLFDSEKIEYQLITACGCALQKTYRQIYNDPVSFAQRSINELHPIIRKLQRPKPIES